MIQRPVMDRIISHQEERMGTIYLLHLLHTQQRMNQVATVVQRVQLVAVETTMHANAVCTAATCAPWECHARLVKMDFALMQCCATLNQAC